MFGPGHAYGYGERRRARSFGVSAPTPTPTPGQVQSASVDASGGILALVMRDVGAGTYADYVLAPNTASPRIVLDITTAGHYRSGGQAVAGSVSRQLVATHVARRTPIVPSSATTPNSNVIDETDNGDGTRTVRLWLDKFVYAGSAATLSLLARWRIGAPAQSVAVTNNSVLNPPMPFMRWITPPRQRVSGPFRVEMMAGSVNPVTREGLAGIRFTATDGVNSVSAWATALSTSPTDGVRCWGATIDPAGLTAGSITIHAEVCPRVGAARITGSGQTAPVLTVSAAEQGLTFAYDPTGTRYPPAYVACDPVNGTAVASAAIVQASIAAARAVPAAHKPANAMCALQAIYLANRSAAAANGQAAISRMIDNGFVIIPAGVTPIAGRSVTTGATTGEGYVTFMGDPADPDPTTNCIIRSMDTTTPSQRVTATRFQNLRIETGNSNLIGGTVWLDHVSIRPKAGQESSAFFITSGAYYAQQVDLANTATGFSPSGDQQRPLIVRSCTSPARTISAPVIVNCSARAVGGWPQITSATASTQADWVCVGNRLYNAVGRPVSWPSWNSGDGITQMVRPMFVNNITERIGTSPEPIWAIGENSRDRMSGGIIESNTLVGERANTLYNDPPTLTGTNHHVDCRVANNYFDWLPTKHDDFYDDTAAATNGGSPNHGYRPWLVESLWVQAGVNFEANALGRRMPAQFEQRFIGRGSVEKATVANSNWALFANDQSALGGGGGNGDYHPAAGSPLIGMCHAARLDVDQAGIARGERFAAGALEAA
ncbi:hypothetical protein ACNI3Q_13840 [Sphingomonas sp. FW199]|uniref:hypothetical protein n=1 Tax=Sphingomonas sp. FW199 TaxID=3400217 RepID=UPI003CF095E6